MAGNTITLNGQTALDFASASGRPAHYDDQGVPHIDARRIRINRRTRSLGFAIAVGSDRGIVRYPTRPTVYGAPSTVLPRAMKLRGAAYALPPAGMVIRPQWFIGNARIVDLHYDFVEHLERLANHDIDAIDVLVRA